MFSVYAFEYNRFINFLLLNFFGCILRLTLEDIHIFMALLFLRLYRLRNTRAQETTRLANIRACTKEQRVLCCSRCLCSDAWTVFGLLGPAVCWKLKHWTEEGNEMTLVFVCIHWGSRLSLLFFQIIAIPPLLCSNPMSLISSPVVPALQRFWSHGHETSWLE